MSFSGPPPPMIPLLPETAPFSPEQRAWLNGFLAGLFVPNDFAPTAVPIPADAAAALTKAERAPEIEADDGAPWHDPSMPL